MKVPEGCNKCQYYTICDPAGCVIENEKMKMKSCKLNAIVYDAFFEGIGIWQKKMLELDLDMLLKGVNVLGSAGILALLRYVTDKVAAAKIMIDRNNNGIPDEEETTDVRCKEGENNVCK